MRTRNELTRRPVQAGSPPSRSSQATARALKTEHPSVESDPGRRPRRQTSKNGLYQGTRQVEARSPTEGFYKTPVGNSISNETDLDSDEVHLDPRVTAKSLKAESTKDSPVNSHRGGSRLQSERPSTSSTRLLKRRERVYTAPIAESDEEVEETPDDTNLTEQGTRTSMAQSPPTQLGRNSHSPMNVDSPSSRERDSQGRFRGGLSDTTKSASPMQSKRSVARANESQLLRENLMHGTFGPEIFARERSLHGDILDGPGLRSAGRARSSPQQQGDQETGSSSNTHGNDQAPSASGVETRTHIANSSRESAAEDRQPICESPTVEETEYNIDHESSSEGPAVIPCTLASVETVLRSHAAELADDHEYCTRRYLSVARKAFDVTSARPAQGTSNNATNRNGSVPPQFLDATSPFADMRPIEVVINSTDGENSDVEYMSQIVQPIVKGAKAPALSRSTICVPVTTFKADDVQVPFYTHYVSTASNFKAENCDKLYYQPYFYDDQEQDPDLTELHKHLNTEYKNLTQKRPRYVQLLHKSTKWKPYVEAFLEEIGCGYKDVLRYLLRPETEQPPDMKLDAKDLKAWQDRGPSRREDFDPEHPRWRAVLKNLPPSSNKELAMAGLACHAFLKVAKFNIWHVARRSSIAEEARRDVEVETKNDPMAEIQAALCRICHRLNCPYHGINDEEDYICNSDEEVEDANMVASQKNRSDDITPSLQGCYYSSDEEGINDEKPVIAPKHGRDRSPKQVRTASSYHAFDHQRWFEKGVTNMMHKRRPFWPCDHEGPCDGKNCSCARQGINCEKACGCSSRCRRRFTGCRCAQKGKPCANSNKCPCRMLNRECDPDLCGTCGALDVLDPVNRYDDSILIGRCHNASVQRNRPKNTKMGVSQVAGCGLYACEDICQGGFISEYKGEVCGHMEGERRGVVYGFRPNNYLFTVADVYDVDSMHYGNKTRFINNSLDSQNINVQARLVLCNMVVRIGLFATRDIKAGEELFFNYGYEKEITQTFWEVGEAPKDKTLGRVGAASSKRKSKAKAQLAAHAPAVATESTPQKERSNKSYSKAQAKHKLDMIPQDDTEDVDYRPSSHFDQHYTSKRRDVVVSSSEDEGDADADAELLNGRHRLPRSVQSTPRGTLNRAEDWDRILAEESDEDGDSEEYHEPSGEDEEESSATDRINVLMGVDAHVARNKKRKRMSGN